MEHTHLVKGLDYALLQKVLFLTCLDSKANFSLEFKVRSEIHNKEQEQEDELENLVTAPKDQKPVKKEVIEEEDIDFKTKSGKSFYR
jgi:hypothetical protein